jgi:mannosyltransferase OCH1-like enzyme
MNTTVPPIIHQIWLGDKTPPIKLMNSWRLAHPYFKFTLWTDDKVERLNLYNRKIYDWLKSPTMKADLLRYELLYQIGGVYVDVDFLCLQPIHHLLNFPFFAAQDNYWWSRKGYIANGFMGCSPHNPLAAALVNEFRTIPFKSNTGHGALTTGPKYLTQIWKKNNYRVEVLPKEDYMLESDTADFSSAYTVHVNDSHPVNRKFYEDVTL